MPEQRRLAALKRLGIMDSEPEERFERLTRIARQYYGVQAALLSVIDEDRQWFKSACGLAVEQTLRSVSFCDHTIRQDGAFIIEDAAADPRFSGNPLVTGSPHIRFYAGIPVREPDGFKVGALCLVDNSPRRRDDIDLDVLRTLASLIEDELARTFNENVNAEIIQPHHLSRAIQRVHKIFLTSSDERVISNVLIGDLLMLTGSLFGFVAEVVFGDKGQPTLKVGAISNLAWNPETQKLYQEVEDRGLIFTRLDSLLFRPVLDGKVLVSDDVMTDPRGIGLPHGHPPIHGYIGIPVFSGDTMTGLIGLANREGGYTANLAVELEPLLQTLGALVERRRLHQAQQDHRAVLEKAANYDELTGLPNRRRLGELFGIELHKANLRQGTVSVCFIDLDGFKAFNDEHGHTAGDWLLRGVAQRLTDTARGHDVVARLAGDEFVAILIDVNDPNAYQRLLDAIRRPTNYKNHAFQLSASMGVTIYPDDRVDADLLLRHADQAMYAAKEIGRNCFTFFDLGTHESRKEQVRLLEQIRNALDVGEFELCYQPKINLKNNLVEGFEGLIRWNHRTRGLLGPLQFLPHVESTEFAAHLGNYVLREGIRTLQHFEAQHLPYRLSLNMSPSHFLGDGFVNDLDQALGNCSTALRSRLTLEVLETMALDTAQSVINTFSACRKRGVMVSLDDFGTGYSSLDYFRRLPVDEIKIDKSFILDMINDPEDAIIVKAIVGLSHSFGRQIVAEGIENSETEKTLIDLGCEFGQGFYYSKPVPLSKALIHATERNKVFAPTGTEAVRRHKR